MPIESLTSAQRAEFAQNALRVLAEIWLDQHGVEASVTARRKENQ